MSDLKSELKFEVLLDRVLGFWPESLDVTQLHLNEAHPELFTVGGLGRLGDSIIEGFEGRADAVLLTGLSDAITATVRSAAFLMTVVKPAALRSSIVRKGFEDRLHRAATVSDLGWTNDDVLLIARYFAANLK